MSNFWTVVSKNWTLFGYFRPFREGKKPGEQSPQVIGVGTMLVEQSPRAIGVGIMPVEQSPQAVGVVHNARRAVAAGNRGGI